MVQLSKRLSLIAEFVNEGSSVCDVGCDHGYLSAFLYLSKKCKSVIATDINQKPLNNAKKNLERLGAGGVKLVLCDGLSKVTTQDADTIIIAGMGGEVISGIIDRAKFLRKSNITLILQPTTAAKELRVYLAKNGFLVNQEKAVLENGKIYSVMKVNFIGKPYELSGINSVIGLLTPDCIESKEYIKKQYKIAKKCASELENVAHKQNEYKYFLELSNKLKNILGG